MHPSAPQAALFRCAVLLRGKVRGALLCAPVRRFATHLLCRGLATVDDLSMAMRKIRPERIFASAASPKGEAQGCAEHNALGAMLDSRRLAEPRKRRG